MLTLLNRNSQNLYSFLLQLAPQDTGRNSVEIRDTEATALLKYCSLVSVCFKGYFLIFCLNLWNNWGSHDVSVIFGMFTKGCFWCHIHYLLFIPLYRTILLGRNTSEPCKQMCWLRCVKVEHAHNSLGWKVNTAQLIRRKSSRNGCANSARELLWNFFKRERLTSPQAKPSIVTVNQGSFVAWRPKSEDEPI